MSDLIERLLIDLKADVGEIKNDIKSINFKHSEMSETIVSHEERLKTIFEKLKDFKENCGVQIVDITNKIKAAKSDSVKDMKLWVFAGVFTGVPALIFSSIGLYLKLKT